VIRLASRALAALVVVAVMLTLVGAGRTFFYCASMGAVMEKCCCAPAERAKTSGPSVERVGCCEEHEISGVPDSGAAERVAQVAPTVALAPTELLLAPPAARFTEVETPRRLWSRPSAPAIPRGPPHRLNCVYLI
jgi:hypothetical protein